MALSPALVFVQIDIDMADAPCTLQLPELQALSQESLGLAENGPYDVLSLYVGIYPDCCAYNVF
jgi:hypothetical protein